MFLGFATKGRFQTCAHYLGDGTVFHPSEIPIKVDRNRKLAHIYDRTEIGAFEVTIPALVKTMTQVSMITVTQVSIETNTREGASSGTAVGLILLSSGTRTLANPWCVAIRNRPGNVSTLIQSVELAPDTNSSDNSRGRPLACRIIDN